MKKYIILLSLFFALLVAGSISSIAYLLDPAVKKLFVERDLALMILIPILIAIAFIIKGFSLYLAKVLMISVSEEVRKDLQRDMLSNLISADTKLINGKHTGKILSSLTMNDFARCSSITLFFSMSS